MDCQRVDGDLGGRWGHERFPWSRELREINRNVFGNHGFRQHQLQAINCTIAEEDVFVLMPTGEEGGRRAYGGGHRGNCKPAHGGGAGCGRHEGGRVKGL